MCYYSEFLAVGSALAFGASRNLNLKTLKLLYQVIRLPHVLLFHKLRTVDPEYQVAYKVKMMGRFTEKQEHISALG